MKLQFRRGNWLLLAVLMLGTFSWAQRDLGAILGSVTDQSGALVPDAKVTLKEDATGLTYGVLTDSGGEFIRPLLKPGTYTVEVDATGFKKAIQHNIVLTPGDRKRVAIVLQVGAASQVVEVIDAPPTLQTESAIIGQDFSAREVHDLPLGGQRVYAFIARLSAGVLPGEPGDRSAPNGGFSANGVTATGQNNFLLNGVDNNANVIDFFNQAAFVLAPAVDAIGEMKVLVNGYNAEYGRAAGGVVNVNIKSGTNKFHGSLYEYLQNAALNANKWESVRAGVPRGPYQQNQFGGSLGGPLIKNRTFWFFDYQGTRVNSHGGAIPGLGSSNSLTIPWPEFKTGDFSRLLTTNVIGTDALGRPVLQGQIFDPTTTRQVNGQFVRDPFPNNQIPQNLLDPAAAQLMALFPDPNQNLSTRLPSNNFFTVTSGNLRINQWDVRVDHRLTEKDSIFGSLSWSTNNKVSSSPIPNPLDSGQWGDGTFHTLGRNAMVSWTRSWTPKFLTETRFAYTRLITDQLQPFSDKNLQQQFGIGGFQTFGPNNGGLPMIIIDNYQTVVGQNTYLPTKEFSLVYDLIQNVSIEKNKHSLKFGFEGRQIKFPFFQVAAPRGQWEFDSDRTNQPGFADTGSGFASWLFGYADSAELTSPNFVRSERYAIAGYAQDDWKITPKLTLNLGLRYEVFSPIGEENGRLARLDRDTVTLQIPDGKYMNTPLPGGFAVSYPDVKVQRGGFSKWLIPWSKTSIAPRLGMAYQLTPKTVLRAGYGIFYGGEENQGGSGNLGLSVPFTSDIILQKPDAANLVPTLGRFSDGIPADIFSLNVPVSITFNTVASDFQPARVQKWNLAVQRELGWKTSLDVSYIGSVGSHLKVGWNSNQLINSPDPTAPVANRYPIPQVPGAILANDSFGYSNYNALAAKLEKHYSNGLNFLASYTYGHTLGYSSTGLSGSPGYGYKGPRNVLDYAADYTNASWDIRHRFVYSAIYDIPVGRGRKFGNAWARPLDFALGGWQVNGILTLQTGQPFTINTRNSVCGCGGNTLPDLVPGKNPNAAPPGGRSPKEWFDTSAFTNPAVGTFGNLGLQSNYGPGVSTVDFSAFKDFPVTEGLRFQFRSEIFNMLNKPQFSVATIDNVQGDGGFGTVNGTVAGSERHIQFALRLMF